MSSLRIAAGVALVIAVCLVTAPLGAQTVSGGGCTMSHFKIQSMFFNFQYLSLVCPETEWWVFVRNTDRGLQVGPAFLRRSPASGFIPVLQSANVADNITLYHTGAHLNDMQFAHAGNAIPTLNASDVGPGGFLVTLLGESTPRVAVELRSRGFSWLCTWNLGPSVSRRGMEMAVWGIWDTGNYDYITEYIFRDDGQISFRAGATGWNNNQEGEDVAHTHDLLWRLHFNLGTGKNTAHVWAHHETSLFAADSESLFNFGREGAVDLDPLKFETVIVEDPQTLNARQHPIGYELQSLRSGTGRHYAAGEEWTLHDAWITRYSPAEDAVTFARDPNWQSPAVYLLGNNANHYGIHNHESIQNESLLLWTTTSVHHEPHDEDQALGDSTNGYKGITLIHWSGFDLVPHNLFDTNPLGGPHRSTCNGPP